MKIRGRMKKYFADRRAKLEEERRQDRDLFWKRKKWDLELKRDRCVEHLSGHYKRDQYWENQIIMLNRQIGEVEHNRWLNNPIGRAPLSPMELLERQREQFIESSRRLWQLKEDIKHIRRGTRRAREAKAWIEDVNPRIVAERDEWMCYLCNKPVDPTRRHPDPYSASLEHVIALVNGGEHSYANCKLSHLRCNLKKGTKNYRVNNHTPYKTKPKQQPMLDFTWSVDSHGNISQK